MATMSMEEKIALARQMLVENGYTEPEIVGILRYTYGDKKLTEAEQEAHDRWVESRNQARTD